jgi:organic hydroperoxide reductase OsmC/OhrA
MQISATVVNSPGQHAVSVRSGDNAQSLAIPAKAAGGSGVNGGEFLMLALATCYCNDLYREAGRLGISLQHVEVEASATFAGVGLAASDVRYRANVQSTASPQVVAQLLRETDTVAEVQNTLRKGVSVRLLG